MDDQTKAKGLMAAGLFILAAIGLIVVLVVLPAVQNGHGAPTAVAQGGGSPMSPAPGGMPGAAGAPGAMPGAPPGMAGPPGGGMGGGMPGAMPSMGAGAPGGAAAGAPAAPGVPAKAVEPLEPSRENPFAPMGAVGGVKQGKIRSELAYTPSPRGMPISLREQYRYPTQGPNGESIHVPSGAPSQAPAGPALPPGQKYLRVTALMRDAQGRVMVVLQAQPGQEGQVLQVGDRWQGYKVEQITNTEMVLVKEEDGKTIRERVRLQVGGAGRRPGTQPGPGGTRPGVTVPGARTPGGGAATPGGGGAQPGIRRPGGARPGAFPGAGGGQQ